MLKKTIFFAIILIAIIFVLLLIVGLLLPKERVFVKKAELKANVETVYAKVTNFKDQASWRPDVKEIIVIDDRTWTEIPIKGKPITFTIVQQKANALFEIRIIEPKHFNGYWVGTFEPTKEGGTLIEFKEVVVSANPFIRTITYLFVDLDKQMEEYLYHLQQNVEHL